VLDRSVDDRAHALRNRLILLADAGDARVAARPLLLAVD
jgi:hypothetical protein